VGTLIMHYPLSFILTSRLFNGYTNVMYIRTVKNNSGKAYYQLVESFRDQGQVKKRVLLTLGQVEDNKIDALKKAIARHQNELEAYENAKKVSVEDTFILGPLLVLETLFERLGINTLLKQIQQRHPKLGFELRAHVFTLIACRFIHPSSKLKVYDHWMEKLYPVMLEEDIQLHTIYRTMDLLSTYKERVEKQLYQHGRDLLNLQVNVVLYDLTTLRFESTRTDLGNLRQFGYSKEMRPDCTQVVFGLLTDEEGIPLGFEVYPGNTFEGETLKSIVTKMKKKFQVKRFIFVADRGLLSKRNLECLREDKGEFIVGMRLGTMKKRHGELFDLSRFKQIHEGLYVYETKHEGDRVIVTWSKARFERDQKARKDILEKILKKLQSKKVNPQAFISNRSYKRFVRVDAKSRPVLNEEAIAEDEKGDGFFGIVTNVKELSAQEAVMHYKELWRIEDAFGEFKGPTLKTRPMFHWKDHRIVGHLVLCFLAYLCEAHMTKLLRGKGKQLMSKAIKDGTIKQRALTVPEAMRELQEVRAVPIRLGSEKKIWVRTDINGNAAKLMSAIGMRLPPRVLLEEDMCRATGVSASS
jgi:transposase